MDTQCTDGNCKGNDLDRHLEQVLRILADLIQAGTICRCVLDFDADHVGVMNRAEPGRMQFYSVNSLLGQTCVVPARSAYGRAAGTRDLPWALANVADLRRRRQQPLHQASLDLERGWTTLRFVDGRIRTAPLECLPVNGYPGRRLAS
jgi:hypothetical protein